VCERTVRDEWAESISLTPNDFDRPGGGYMVHPMYSLPEELQHGSMGNIDNWPSNVCVTREKSYNFGWENYPSC
jgi:hypothetical protein